MIASAQPSGGKHPVAIVNGVKIPYSAFERARLTRLRNLGKELKDTAALNEVETDAILLSLIDAELTRQEANRRGITVTRQQAIDLLVANPPGYIRDVFVDKYDPAILRKVIANPETILKYVSSPQAPRKQIVQEWEADIEHLLWYYELEELRRRLVDALYAENPLTDADVRHRYFAERTILDGSVLRVLHSTFPDSLITVTEAEVRDWYENHKEEYRIPESRFIRSLIIPVIPSSSDSAKQLAQLQSALKTIESAPLGRRLERVEGLIHDLPPNRIPVDRFISPKEFTGEIRNDLVVAHKGDVLGPYPLEKESLLLYVAEEAPSEDTLIRARQILIQVTADMAQEQKDELWRVANLLRDSIDNENEFIEAAQYFNSDPRNHSGDGDLGYGERGLYVREFDSALFVAPMGVPVGPVKSRFGYHLIWVKDKQARKFNLRELRFPLTASDSMKQAVQRDAEAYARILRSGGSTDSILSELRLNNPRMVVDSGSVLERLEPYGDVLSTGEFAFNAQVGDVDVLQLPFDRVAVIELLHVWEEGVPSYEDVYAYPNAHARRKKQLDSLEVRLEDLAGKINPDMLLGKIREWAPMAEVFLLERTPIIDMPDEDPTLLDSLVAITKNEMVTGPVRGVHGLYFLRVKYAYGPAEGDFRLDRDQYSREYRERYRKELLENTLLEARHYGEIEVGVAH